MCETGIIAILSCHNHKVKHTHTHVRKSSLSGNSVLSTFGISDVFILPGSLLEEVGS